MEVLHHLGAVEAHANALEDDPDLQSKRDRALRAVQKFLGTADDGRGFNELVEESGWLAAAACGGRW